MRKTIAAIACLTPLQVMGADIDKALLDIADGSVAIHAIKSEIEAELSRIGIAAAARRPELSVGATWRQWQDSSLPRPSSQPQSRPGAQLTWLVWDWGQLQQRIRSEHYSVRAGVEKGRQKVVAQLQEAGQAFILAWASQAKIYSSQEALSCAESAQSISNERRKSNVATEAQMRSVQSELAFVRSDILDAQADYARAIATLLRWGVKLKIDRKPLMLRAANTGIIAPEVIIAEADAARWKAEAEAIRLSRLPTVDAIGSIDHTTGKTYSDVMFGARVKVDVFDNSGSAEKMRHALMEGAAAIARKAAAEQYQKAKEELSIAIGAAAIKAVKSAESTIYLERVRLDDTRAAFAAGRGDAMPIAQACRRIATGQRQMIEARARLASSVLQQRADLGDIP